MNWIINFLRWLLGYADKDERVLPTPGTIEWEVLAILRAMTDGLTDQELGFIISDTRASDAVVQASRSALRSRGFVADSGRTRRNQRTGRDNIIWVAI